jgi:hypothetical protein
MTQNHRNCPPTLMVRNNSVKKNVKEPNNLVKKILMVMNNQMMNLFLKVEYNSCFESLRARYVDVSNWNY